MLSIVLVLLRCFELFCLCYHVVLVYLCSTIVSCDTILTINWLFCIKSACWTIIDLWAFRVTYLETFLPVVVGTKNMVSYLDHFISLVIYTKISYIVFLNDNLFLTERKKKDTIILIFNWILMLILMVTLNHICDLEFFGNFWIFHKLKLKAHQILKVSS